MSHTPQNKLTDLSEASAVIGTIRYSGRWHGFWYHFKAAFKCLFASRERERLMFAHPLKMTGRTLTLDQD